jgi:hypothetical protein
MKSRPRGLKQSNVANMFTKEKSLSAKLVSSSLVHVCVGMFLSFSMVCLLERKRD